MIFCRGFFRYKVSILSAVVEDEITAVTERDLFGLPDGPSVVVIGLCSGGVPFLVEPVQIQVEVQNAPAA